MKIAEMLKSTRLKNETILEVEKSVEIDCMDKLYERNERKNGKFNSIS